MGGHPVSKLGRAMTIKITVEDNNRYNIAAHWNEPKTITDETLL